MYSGLGQVLFFTLGIRQISWMPSTCPHKLDKLRKLLCQIKFAPLVLAFPTLEQVWHYFFHFSAKPAITGFIRANKLLASKTVSQDPKKASDDPLTHCFSACTVLKPASLILVRVSLLQRQPFKNVGNISSLVKRCWVKWRNVHGFPVEITTKWLIFTNKDIFLCLIIKRNQHAPQQPPPSPKKIGISLFSLWKGKLQLSGLFMSCGGGGGEFHNSLCHWDGKFDTIKEEWKIWRNCHKIMFTIVSY